MAETPEQRARREIDADLTAAGWQVGERLKPLMAELNERLAA
jgi:type I site-specific restriction endonuclease